MFVTHPHEDHFSLIAEIFGPLMKKDTPFFLGGRCDDWNELLALTEQCEKQDDIVDFIRKRQESNCKSNSGIRFIKSIKARLLDLEDKKNTNAARELREYIAQKHSYTLAFFDFLSDRPTWCKHYCGDIQTFFEGKPYVDLNLLDGVSIKIFNGGMPRNESNDNQKSTVIKVTYNERSILLTGDAEGEAIDRQLGPLFLNINQAIKLLSLSHDEASNDFLKSYFAIFSEQKEEKDIERLYELYCKVNNVTSNILPSMK